MTQPGIVQKPGPPTGNEDAPFWMRLIMSNAQAYADFMIFCAKGVSQCEQQIADFVAQNKMGEAQLMTGKRESILEMRHLLEAYRKEGEVK